MVQSFDWIRNAAHDMKLKNRILNHMRGDNNELVLYDKFVISFHNDENYMIIDRVSDEFVKVLKAQVPYDVLRNMLDGNWNDFTGIIYLD
ncbi:MAG: hypothetical protein KHZ87_07520 [Clostridiales bacterium]|nr:hypothetical protein [Clostridiales bacterium]MDU0940098.1 hypothetical protein [Clostridiales bacterium]MDU1042769.1 hypothetical protein [Clostridiales bacterium]